MAKNPDTKRQGGSQTPAPSRKLPSGTKKTMDDGQKRAVDRDAASKAKNNRRN